LEERSNFCKTIEQKEHEVKRIETELEVAKVNSLQAQQGIRL
jgi:hypothetical protein